MKSILISLLFFITVNVGNAATYYVRHDGSAANKGAATSSGAAATSMSVATFNGESFSDNDIIVFSNKGGTFTAKVVLPTGGSSVGNRIRYIGETDYLPTIAQSASTSDMACSVSNVEIRDFTLSGSAYGLEFVSGTLSGIVTYNLIVASADEKIRHYTATTVTHYNPTLTGAESLTSHAAGTITVEGGNISGYVDGALRGISSNSWVMNDVVFTAAATGRLLGDTSVSTGSYTFQRCKINDLATGRSNDLRTAAAAYFYNCIFTGLTTGDFYLLLPAATRVMNCVFDGNGRGGPSTQVIFNNAGGTVNNTIFYNTGGKQCSSSTGVDYCTFYNAGTAQGAHSVTGDPGFTSAPTDYTIGSGSNCKDVGYDNSAYFTDDFTGTTRTGTWDIGAYEYVSGATPTSHMRGLLGVGR